MKEEIINYYNSFRKGYNYVLFGSDPEDREVPIVNYDDLESIGYNAGFQYGEYCEQTSQTMSISSEQLLAVMDKSFTRALAQIDAYHNRENQYIVYKTAFIDGKGDVLLKYSEKDESFNLIPDLDATDISSIGYYDEYCYYLNRILNIEDSSELSSPFRIEEICRENFNRSAKIYSFDRLEIGINK